ncbi:MAG TPA: neutral zinc metallopeptidase, partial [Thermomicrobiales bacterium]|nr:neutral zinc metallopeptidase [Thermomicrobiales bacterium]
AEVLEETGPFGWSAVLAHEWGHHVQALVGAEAGRFGSDPVDLELQADCLSAIVAQDSVARGEIALDDVDGAVAVIQLAGDVPGTDPSDPHAHGSANERMAWFEAGFDRGFAGCDFSMRSG